MKKIKLAFFAGLALVLVVSVLVAGCAPKEPEVIELSFNTWAPNENHPLVKNQFLPWGNELASRTAGGVKVTMYYSNALAGDKVAYDAVKEGIADISSVVPSGFPERFPLAKLFELPVIYSSGVVSSKAIPDMWAQYPQFLEQYSDYKMLWAGTNDVAQVLSPLPEPVKTLEELQGQVVASYMGAKTALVEALGGSPETTTGPELYSMYERKVIDREICNIAFIPSFNQHEVLGYITLVGLGSDYLQIIMNVDKYNSLPSDVRKVIDEISPPYGLAMGAMFESSAAEVLALLRADYPEITIYELPAAERAKWAEAVRPLWGEWIASVDALGYPGQELLDAFISACNKYQ